MTPFLSHFFQLKLIKLHPFYIGCQELILLCCFFFTVGARGGGSGDHISFSWVNISLHVEFHPAGLLRSYRFMVRDKMLGRLSRTDITLLYTFLCVGLVGGGLWDPNFFSSYLF